jgi:hypothetical protein
VPHDCEMFSQTEGVPGQPKTNFNNRPHSFVVQAPSRTAVVYANMDDSARWAAAKRSSIAEEPLSDKGVSTTEAPLAGKGGFFV